MTEPVGVLALGPLAAVLAEAVVAVASETPTVASTVMAAKTRRPERVCTDIRFAS
jgi:hypothetical protein